VGEKGGSDPETAWVFYYHVIDNSGPTPLIGPQIHPPTARTAGYVEQSAGATYDSLGNAHYIWRDWGEREGGARGLHYQSLSAQGVYGTDELIYGGVSDFSDITIDGQDRLHVVTTTAWATEGILYAIRDPQGWRTYAHFRELYPVDQNGSNLFNPDHNVPAIAYDQSRGLSYLAFSAGETEIHHSYAYINSYFAYVDSQGTFSEAFPLHDESRASGSKYNGVRLAAASNRGVWAVIPLLRQDRADRWEVVLRAIGGAEAGG
jgi:hypothetical protein